MKHHGLMISLVLGIGMLLPISAIADPGGVPRQCKLPNGAVNCSNPNCSRFCGHTPPGHQKGSKHKVKNGHKVTTVEHRVVVTPPPRPVEHRVVVEPARRPVEHRVVVEPARRPAHVVVHQAPPPQPHYVAVRRSRHDIDRDIDYKVAERNRLNIDLDNARNRAQYNYDICRASLPPYVSGRCMYDEYEIRRIQRDLDDNQRDLDRLHDERRAW